MKEERGFSGLQRSKKRNKAEDDRKRRAHKCARKRSRSKKVCEPSQEKEEKV